MESTGTSLPQRMCGKCGGIAVVTQVTEWSKFGVIRIFTFRQIPVPVVPPVVRRRTDVDLGEEHSRQRVARGLREPQSRDALCTKPQTKTRRHSPCIER